MRRLVARAGLAVAGLCLGVLLAEALSRLSAAQPGAELFYAAPDSAPEGFFLTDAELGMVPAPDFDGVGRSLDRRVRLRTNAQGLRGGPAEAGGWLLLGDSFVLGAQVDEADTAASRLSQLLGEPVHNAGVDGYSTWQAAGRYARLAEPLGVRGAALVLFVGNDLHDNAAFPARQARSRGTISGRPIPRPAIDPVVRLLSRHSHAYARYRVWRRSREATGMAERHRKRWRDQLRILAGDGQKRLAQLLPDTAAALDALVDQTTRRGDALVVALAPPAVAVHADRLPDTFALVGLDPADATVDAPTAAVAGLLAERGVPVCDLTADLRAAAAGGATVYFTWDGHWTPAGHAVAAQALARCIEALP